MEVFSPWETIADLATRGEPGPETQPVEINGRELCCRSRVSVSMAETVFAFRD